MQRFSLALTALTVAAIAVAPTAHAAPDFDELRRANLDQDVVDFDDVRRDHLDRANL